MGVRAQVQLLVAGLLTISSVPPVIRARRMYIEVPYHIRTHNHVHTVIRPLPVHVPAPTAAPAAPAPAAISLLPVPVPMHVPASHRLTAVAVMAGVPHQLQQQQQQQLPEVLPAVPGRHESNHFGMAYQRSQQRSHVYR